VTVEKSARPLATEQVVWAIGSIAQLHRVPFSREILLQAFVPPYGFDQLPRILSRLGLNVRTRKGVERLDALRMTCLLGIDQPPIPDAAGDGKEDRPAPEVALLVKVDADVAWIFLPGDESPRSLSCDMLLSWMQGTAIECSAGIAAVADPDRPVRDGFGFSWFVPVLMRYRKIWRDVLIASLMIQLIALATPLFTQVVIDKVVVHQTSSTLAVIAVALFVFIVFNAALTWVRQYLVLHTGNRVDAQLGVAVLEHLLHLPLRYFEHRPTGVVAARLHAVETIREFVASSLVTLLLDLPFLLIFVGVMFWYSVPLTLMVLVILGLIAGLSIVVAPLFRTRLNHQFMLGARNQAFLTEYIASLETVKSLQMEPQLVRRYRDHLASYLEAGFHTRQIGNTYGVVSGALEQFMTLVVLTAGAWIVMNGGSTAGADDGVEAPFTIGMLVAFQMFAGKLSQPLMRLVGLWQQFQQASISIRRLADIMDAPTEPYAVVPSRETRRRGRVEITDLAFRYADDRPFLYQHLNFTLEAGRTAVVLGPSGSGKSTLAKLLLGFYLPSGGQIRIDGTDIRHLAANELRAYFGVVPQETSLFSGTIYDNLQVANPHATFEMVVQACRMAEIHDTIEALPRGYQTEIGERGTGLSGGQKQRLAIARALLKRPSILIFDEATSALDGETAEQFARTVNALRGRVSMLFITHQLPRSLQVDAVVRIGGSSPSPSPSAAAAADERRPHAD
jgi:subfamily B ATP-binding cassette protein HlyB/CyaB